MSDKIRSLDDFLLLLKGVKLGKDGQCMALCPGHDDRTPSLSIKQDNGKLLINCFAGCDTTAILKPLRLEAKDLFVNSHKVKPTLRPVEAIYHYDGFEVVRTKPKGFFQRRPDGDGGYINNIKGVTLSLYHQDEIPQSIANGKTIFIVEGEKDVDRLRTEGFVATCNPGGANKWRDIYSQALIRADVIIIPDNDPPGHDHVSQVAKSCYGKVTSTRILELPSDCKDVSEWFDKGHTSKELMELASQCPDYTQPDLPQIIVNARQLREVTNDSLIALYKANIPEHIFQRTSHLARISLDEERRAFIEELTESSLRGCLTRVADFFNLRESKDGHEYNAVPPPLDVVRDCLSLGYWEFPPLVSITEVPVVRPDGSIVNKAGYDGMTRLFYSPSPKLSLPYIPDEPTESEIKAAIELAQEPVCNFPFDSDASNANALATMFSPIVSPMINGPKPLAVIDKPQSGTGASLLAETISILATGRNADMITAPRDDEGWRKEITSLLIKGPTVIILDNVERTLSAPSLAAVLTATSFQDRVLGRSQMIILPNHATWMATGNNIHLGGDLARRSIWVRMNARMSRPWQRDVKRFKHEHLIQWVSENRGRILAAILTIVRAWVLAGMPEAQTLPNLGSYDSYCRIVGGVLAFMGVKGFLKNLNSMYNEVDTETPQWEGFLQTLREVLGDKVITAAELTILLSNNTNLRTALPEAIADTNVRNYSRILGNAIAKRKDERYPNGFSIVKAGETNRAARWKVMSPHESDSYQSSFNNESQESSFGDQREEKKEDDNNACETGAEQDSSDSF